MPPPSRVACRLPFPAAAGSAWFGSPGGGGGGDGGGVGEGGGGEGGGEGGVGDGGGGGGGGDGGGGGGGGGGDRDGGGSEGGGGEGDGEDGEGKGDGRHDIVLRNSTTRPNPLPAAYKSIMHPRGTALSRACGFPSTAPRPIGIREPNLYCPWARFRGG